MTINIARTRFLSVGFKEQLPNIFKLIIHPFLTTRMLVKENLSSCCLSQTTWIIGIIKRIYRQTKLNFHPCKFFSSFFSPPAVRRSCTIWFSQNAAEIESGLPNKLTDALSFKLIYLHMEMRQCERLWQTLGQKRWPTKLTETSFDDCWDRLRKRRRRLFNKFYFDDENRDEKK